VRAGSEERWHGDGGIVKKLEILRGEKGRMKLFLSYVEIL
jgi:hypothetical protein